MSKESGHMLSRAFTTVPILPGPDFGVPAAKSLVVILFSNDNNDNDNIIIYSCIDLV